MQHLMCRQTDSYNLAYTDAVLVTLVIDNHDTISPWNILTGNSYNVNEACW